MPSAVTAPFATETRTQRHTLASLAEVYRSAEVTVGERLSRVILTGASSLDYFGNAVIDSQTITGGSTINQR